MIIILISLFAGAAAFFISKCLFGNLKNLEKEGAIYRASLNKKVSLFKPSIFRYADKIGRHLDKIKNEKFHISLEKNAEILRSLGGSFAKINAKQFFVLRIFAALAGAIFCLFIISSNILLAALFSLGAFYLPALYIKETFNKRKEEIYRQLPDFTDLLSIMLESGADFFSATDKISAVLKGALSDELKEALLKISFGYDKKAALAETAKKCRQEQLSSFVRTVNTAMEAGVGMSETLRRLAFQIRDERSAFAEKKAQEAPVKLLIPLVLFIFPTIFIVIFGPIAISFMKNGGF